MEVDTPNVHLETDIGAERGEELAWAIEDLFLALLRVFPRCSLEVMPRVEATVFARDADYRSVAAPTSAGMLISPRLALVHTRPRLVMPYEQRGRLAQVVAHELTHRLVLSCMPSAPVWLHEGLATYFETIRVHDDRIVVGTAPFHFNALGGGGSFMSNGVTVREIGRREVPSVPELLALPPNGFYAPGHSQGNYAAAWLLVHYLLLGPDRSMRASFRAYLAQLAQPVSAGALFQYAFASTNLPEAVSEYRSERRRLVRTVPYAPSPIHPITSPMSAPRVHTRWAELLARGEEGHAAAREHLEWADDLRSLLLRATMLDGAEREALVEAATVRAPGHLDVLYARARVAMNAPDDERATQLVEEMSARDDLRSWDRTALGQLLLARGRFDEALAQAIASLDVERDWEASMLAGAALLALSRSAEAIPHLEMALVQVAEHGPERTGPIEALLARARTALERAPVHPSPSTDDDATPGASPDDASDAP